MATKAANELLNAGEEHKLNRGVELEPTTAQKVKKEEPKKEDPKKKETKKEAAEKEGGQIGPSSHFRVAGLTDAFVACCPMAVCRSSFVFVCCIYCIR